MHAFTRLLQFQRFLLFSPPHNKFSSPVWGSKTKKHRKVRIPLLHPSDRLTMDPEAEVILAPLRASVKEQGDLVRSLKQSNADKLEIQRAVSELKTRKKALEEKEIALAPVELSFDRNKMEDLLKRRFFYDQSFAIYGGVSGQFDLGPMGCATKSNLLSAWKKYFVLEEQMLEVDCTSLTPEVVLKASGHVDKFADLMVKDLKNGECFRLDHLIKSHLESIKSSSKTSEDTKKECDLIISRLDGLTKQEMSDVLQKFSMKSPITGNDLSEPLEFNLMFETHIGPTGLMKGFLRPETAQGIFVNFKRLLEFNQGKLPFAAAQIGNAYRNEISPRSGLLRVREFTMAEIEHFCDPSNKVHPKFEDVKNVELNLLSASNQMDGKSAVKTTIGEAVHSKDMNFDTLSSESNLVSLNYYLSDKSYIIGFVPSKADALVIDSLKKFTNFTNYRNINRWKRNIESFNKSERLTWPNEFNVGSLKDLVNHIFGSDKKSKKLVDNETLGYFMARIHMFLVKIGTDPKRLRFRQHMSNEMAHYACDCWDAELLTSYGWVECVGCADRSAFDLKQHTKATGVKLVAEKKLPAPIKVPMVEIIANKGALGKVFRKEAKVIIEALSKYKDIDGFEKTLNESGTFKLEVDDKVYEVTKEMVSIKREEVVKHVEELVPSVIEPSFGVGRIMYALFEHNFKVRQDDEQKTYLSLPPIIAPLKCSVLPLSNNVEFAPLIKKLSNLLTEVEISHKVDDSSGSIGRRYARTDEIAIPFGICIDFDSLKDDPPTATLRERDSTLQVRMKIEEIPQVIKSMSDGKLTWDKVLEKYPKFEQQESKK